jgi:2-keto-3-deoxy-galactonokinase
VKAIFRIWVIVFGLVGAQMGWVLRPFIGAPDQPFTLFREREGNFFQAVWEQIVSMLRSGG